MQMYNDSYCSIYQRYMLVDLLYNVWFSAGWGTKEAENVFLTRGWEYGLECVGVSGHVRSSRFTLRLPSDIAWHGSQLCVRTNILFSENQTFRAKF